MHGEQTRVEHEVIYNALKEAAFWFHTASVMGALVVITNVVLVIIISR